MASPKRKTPGNETPKGDKIETPKRDKVGKFPKIMPPENVETLTPRGN